MRKTKIWNSQEGKWFMPTYPAQVRGKNNQLTNTEKTEEILFTQSGDMYMRVQESKNANNTLSLLNDEVWIRCEYTGLKDKTEKKIYEHDQVQGEYKVGVIMLVKSCWIVRYEDDAMDVPLSEINEYLEVIGSTLEQKKEAQ